MKILILCTGNSCRSQMAEGILRKLYPEADISSAGTKPETDVNPYAVQVMAEMGIDISDQYPKSVNQFIKKSFDYVITVCDNARQICPVFTGKVRNRMHIGFEDPADATGTDEQKLAVYRKIRDQIFNRFGEFDFE